MVKDNIAMRSKLTALTETRDVCASIRLPCTGTYGDSQPQEIQASAW